MLRFRSRPSRLDFCPNLILVAFLGRLETATITASRLGTPEPIPERGIPIKLYGSRASGGLPVILEGFGLTPNIVRGKREGALRPFDRPFIGNPAFGEPKRFLWITFR
jgi:hypothetical protein